MDAQFGCPCYDSDGICSLTDLEAPAGMRIAVHQLRAGEFLDVNEPDLESAFLLMGGSVRFQWQGQSADASRKDIFSEAAWCLHVCHGVAVKITALSDCELLVQQTINDHAFTSKLYTPKDLEVVQAKYLQWEGTAKRDIVTIFDYTIAPWSNMVLGEVYHYPGRWSSYIPHSHEQPEVYYYRFDKPQGFGGCFIGDDVFKVTNGSFCSIPGGLTHPQVAAPGYRMYYVWMIHHLPGNPWTDRVDDPAHLWLLDQP